jgi:hypothetical protein
VSVNTFSELPIQFHGFYQLLVLRIPPGESENVLISGFQPLHALDEIQFFEFLESKYWFDAHIHTVKEFYIQFHVFHEIFVL